MLTVSACSRQKNADASPEPQGEPLPVTKTAHAELLEKAGKLAGAMGNEQLAGQVLMIGVDGSDRLSEASKVALLKLMPGAVILFGFNVGTDPRSVFTLTEDIRALANDGSLPPFVAIDHEGGSVYRFKGGLTRLPSAAVMGLSAVGQEAGPGSGAPVVAAALARAAAAGTAAGTELKVLGITMNLAPVVEALSAENRAFLVDRAWSDSPDLAGRLSAAFIEACQAGGVATVAKHFPGNASADPHRGLPLLEASPELLEASYYSPFRLAIRSGTSAVMMSHALVSSLDADLPASLSARAIGTLKARFGFKGIVMTDDLAMAALAGYGSLGECAVLALNAGADMLMATGGNVATQIHTALLKAIDEGQVPKSRLVDAASRIVFQKLLFGLQSDADEDRIAMLNGLPELVKRNSEALSKSLSSW